MAPVYADHPFQLIPDPRSAVKEGEKHDMFEEFAGEMGCVHNCFIRGINSVYLQAPHIKPSDTVAFCNYAHTWYAMITLHHTEEEAVLFPGIEAMAGEAGIMEANVEQHHAFHDGLEAYAEYTKACAEGRKKYDAAHLVSIIDSFGPALTEHLTDEIKTLIGLRRFGEEKMKGFPALGARVGENALKHAGFTKGLIFFLINIDWQFEGGRWTKFPPAPGHILFLLRHVFYFVNWSWWKFGPCEKSFKLRPLYAVPSE